VILVENFYINRKYKLNKSIISSFIGNLLSIALIINSEINIKLKQAVAKKESKVSFFGQSVSSKAAESIFVHLTWSMHSICVLAIIALVATYKYARSSKTVEAMPSKNTKVSMKELRKKHEEGNDTKAKPGGSQRKAQRDDESLKNWIPEVVSIQIGMLVLKIIILIASVNKPYKSLIYLGLLVQVVAFHAIVEED